MAYLSILVLAFGSEALYYNLCVVREQLRPMDEVMVIGVGQLPVSRQIFLNVFGIRQNTSYVEAGPEQASFLAMSHSHGIWKLALQDTDLLTRKALDMIRAETIVADEQEKPPVLRFACGTEVWCHYDDPEIKTIDRVVVLKDALGGIAQG